jgi:hypothetical protein
LIFHGAETVLGAPIADRVGFAEISVGVEILGA